MKKITEWLDMLKEPYRSEALALFKESVFYRERKNRTYISLKSALEWAFDWSHNGGHDKWHKVVKGFNPDDYPMELLKRDYYKIPRPIREEFERMALRVLNKQQSQVEAGARQKLFLSARYIVWKIRMETTLIQEGEYKVNDHISPCLSRMFVKTYPKYKGVFEMRKSKYDVA